MILAPQSILRHITETVKLSSSINMNNSQQAYKPKTRFENQKKKWGQRDKWNEYVTRRVPLVEQELPSKWSTKRNTENSRLSNVKPTLKQGCIHLFREVKQIILH